MSTGGAGLAPLSTSAQLRAGPGDSIFGGTGEDRLEGGTDSDMLSGDDGDDVVFGQEGSDRLMGGEGDDLLDGGEDNDIAFFVHAPGPVHASLATGEATGWGEDRLASIEWLEGSQHADVLEGDNQTNEIRGNGGDDILLGLGGDDFLFGEEGADSLFGGDGDDFLNADETYDIPGPDRTDEGQATIAAPIHNPSITVKSDESDVRRSHDACGGKWRDGHRPGFDRRACIKCDFASLGNFNQLQQPVAHRAARAPNST